jgi:DHA1 family bicyclomycin/chloramphenicol resistance-like MFS transporter
LNSPTREQTAGPGRRGRALHPVAFVGLLGLLSSLGPASMDIYLPGLPELEGDLGVSQALAQVTISAYLIGLGGGQLLAGPISDILGRRRPILYSLAAFAIASLGCMLAPSVEVLTGARFLQGITAAAGTVVSRAVIRDLHAGAAGARLLSRMVMVYGLAPVLAPAVGALVLSFSSWRGTFGALLAMAAVLALAASVLLPETLPPERRRSGLVATRADFGVLLGNRTFVGYAAAIACAATALVGYIATSSFVIQDVYGASPQLFGVLFGALGLGVILGSQINAQLLARHSPRQLLGWAVAAFVLDGVAMLALVLAGAPLWAVCPTFFVLMCGWGFIPSNATALAMQDHPERAGSASALVGFCQFGLPAFCVPLIGVAGESSATPMAATVLVAALLCALALRLVPPHAQAGTDISPPAPA